jgi:Fe-S cluster assembly protein SufD
VRQKALSHFQNLGFPTARRGNEEWKYTNVAPIANATFEHSLDVGAPRQVGAALLHNADLRQIAPWNDSWTNMVFVDGHHAESLSAMPSESDGTHVMNLAEAILTRGDTVEEHLTRYATIEDDGFIAVNTAFLHDGAFVHVPNDRLLPATLHLIFISTDRGRPTVSHPRVLVVAGRHSRVTILESYIGLSQAPYFTNAVVEIVVGEGARVEHYNHLAENPNAFHVRVTRVHQGQDSSFSSTSFAMGAAVARNDLHVFLNAPGSSCFLRGLYLTTGTQHIDNHISIDHINPHCTSRQYYKGILAGRSRAVYSGKVLVHKGAVKTDAHQADKNLILSEGAEVDTKPSLEIYADDVKCGHGATAGQVAQDALFYMRSRGLDLETATTLLVHGFASEIIDAIQLEPYRVYLDQLFSRSLPSFQVGVTP